MEMHHDEQDGSVNRYRLHYPRFEQIPHYYGDVVRVLLLGTAVIMLGGAPFYADALTQQLPYLIVGAVIAVALAALTSPRSVFVMRLNAIASGVGAVVFEYWALWYYQSGSIIEFTLRQVIALLCMFAFYYGLKTLRSMLMGDLGRQADPAEFEDETTEAEDEIDSFDEPAPEDGLGHTPAVEDDLGND
jgi:hypothetical protein